MPKPVISFSFDDGWRSQYNYAMPLLHKYSIKATFYIISEFLFFDHEMYMGIEEIRKISEQHHEIGAHSVTHPDLSTSILRKGHEIALSRKHFKEKGIIVKSFAYPYGLHNLIARFLVKLAGFNNARMVGDDFNKRGSVNRWMVKGRFVKNNTALGEIIQWIEEAAMYNYWLVLIFHQIEPQPAEYGCEPELLGQICKEVRNSNLKVLPVSEAFVYFNSTR